MMCSSLIVNAEHSGMLCTCFDDKKHCDAACGVSGNDAMPRDLMMVIFYWNAREVRVRLLHSVKSLYWPSVDGVFALRSYMKLEEVWSD